jgi:hypothetical protein
MKKAKGRPLSTGQKQANALLNVNRARSGTASLT